MAGDDGATLQHNDTAENIRIHLAGGCQYPHPLSWKSANNLEL